MHTLFIGQFIANEVVRAIGWTLIHSLWQGFALAVVAGILILFTRKSKPSLRYNLFTGLFFLFIAGVAVTFLYQLESPDPLPVLEKQGQTQFNVQVTVTGTPGVLPQAAVQPGFMEQFRMYFNGHAPLLVTCWFVIFLGKMLWLLSGLIYIQRIKNYKTFAPDITWAHAVTELSDRLGLKTTVRLLESGLVKVPTAVGLLKPLILMPLGLMVKLPADQVEAVLLHELAHIRRRDFIVNLVQHFAETIFFFNPALLWISARIREEREHCCDDMAISVMQSKTGYIRALVSFQEYHLDARTKYALAFPGKKKLLLDRVKRIINNHNKTLNMAEKSFLLICFSLIGMMGLVFSQPDKPVDKLKNEPKAKQEVVMPDAGVTDASRHDVPVDDVLQDDIPHDVIPVQAEAPSIADKFNDPATVKEGTTLEFDETRNGTHYHIYLFKRAGKLYQVETTNEAKVARIKVDGKVTYLDGNGSTPVEHNAAAISLLDEIYQSYKPYDAVYQPYVPKDSVPVFRKKGVTISGNIQHTYKGHEYFIKVADNKATGLTIDGKNVPDDELPGKYSLINELFRDIEPGFELKAPVPPAPPAAPSALRPASPAPPAAGLSPKPPVPPAASPRPPAPPAPPADPYEGIVGDILADMVADGYLEEISGNISFELNAKGFRVNGKEQSKEVFKKYKAKYLKSNRNTYSFSRSGNTTTSTHSHVYEE